METAKMSPTKPVEKEKVLFAQVIASRPKENVYHYGKTPYYSITFQTLDGKWHNGYGSYYINYVYEWLDTCFEIVKPEASAADESYVRKTDDLGRVVIPRDIQKFLGIKEGTEFEFSVLADDSILMRPVSKSLKTETKNVTLESVKCSALDGDKMSYQCPCCGEWSDKDQLKNFLQLSPVFNGTYRCPYCKGVMKINEF